MAKKTIAVIIPAAGFGQRMQSDIAKQFIKVNGQTILAHTVGKIQAWAQTYNHQVSVMVALSAGASLPKDVTGVQICQGGKTRADSVANALTALAKGNDFDWAMVHDAARPLVAISDIEKLYQQLKNDTVGGILAKKITATVKKAAHGEIQATIDRQWLWLAQTPQLFRFDLLQESLKTDRASLTDEASGIEAMGLKPKIIAGSRDNLKITTAEDLAYFQRRLEDIKY